jgi:hypothetical protein
MTRVILDEFAIAQDWPGPNPLIGESSMKKIFPILILVFCIFSTPAYAYIGPGLGAGALATILGVLLGIVMLIAGIIWYPIKRLIRSLKSKK